MPQLTPVVKNLIIINVLFFLGTIAWKGNTDLILVYADVDSILDLGRNSLAAYIPTSKYFRIHQVVTSMFMHGEDLSHLLFNMLGLAFFGGTVESYLGPRRFLNYYLLCGFGALLTFWLFEYTFGADPRTSVLGASGAVYGVLAGFAFIAPNAVVQLIIPPIPLKAKYLVAGLLVIDLYGGLTRYSGSNTAHFAHIGGALTGLALLFLWRGRGRLYGGRR